MVKINFIHFSPDLSNFLQFKPILSAGEDFLNIIRRICHPCQHVIMFLCYNTIEIPSISEKCQWRTDMGNPTDAIASKNKPTVNFFQIQKRGLKTWQLSANFLQFYNFFITFYNQQWTLDFTQFCRYASQIHYHHFLCIYSIGRSVLMYTCSNVLKDKTYQLAEFKYTRTPPSLLSLSLLWCNNNNRYYRQLNDHKKLRTHTGCPKKNASMFKRP